MTVISFSDEQLLELLAAASREWYRRIGYGDHPINYTGILGLCIIDAMHKYRAMAFPRDLEEDPEPLSFPDGSGVILVPIPGEVER